MLLKLSKLFVVVSLFAVVIVMTTTFFPFIGGKDYFFRFMVELALICFLLWWAFSAAPGEVKEMIREASRKPLFIAVSAFVLIFLLASLFAYDIHAAFWSNYERGEGAFQMLHYYAFFLLLVLIFKTERDWRMLFKWSLVAAVLMVLYGVAAAALWSGFIGPYNQMTNSNFWGRLFSDTRFQGSLGNPAYVAPYLIFSIFYALYLWLGSKLKKHWSRIAVYGGLILFFLVFFILSQTRGAFFGLCAAIIAFLVMFIIKSSPRTRRISAIVLGVLIIVGGLLLYFANSPVVQKIPGSRLLDLSVLSTDSFKTRIWTWGSAWQGFLERPILGWGPENFSTVFDKFFNPNHFIPGQGTETWFDRAHSVFFDYLTETGVLGLLSYLSIFAVFFWELSKREFYSEGERSSVGKALLMALPVGYLVQGVVIFDVLPMYINLFLFFAFGFYLFYRKNVEHS